jgi:hypothetical protein
MFTIFYFFKYTSSDIITIQKQKKELRGGFGGRRFVEIAEHNAIFEEWYNKYVAVKSPIID